MAASRLVKKLALPNTSYITNTFDTVARELTTKLNNSTHTTLNSHAYTYKGAHQRTLQTFPDASTAAYTYDNLGQLLIADNSAAANDRGYIYDAAGNLTKRTNNATPTTFSGGGVEAGSVLKLALLPFSSGRPHNNGASPCHANREFSIPVPSII
jgi:YD repeat-containing protein